MKLKRRLVVYVGYDPLSADLLRKVMSFKALFDDVTVVHIPEVKKEVLKNLEIPSIIIEDVQ